ncbi:MAG: hypothetical protein IJP75_10625 [Bacteroidaceae bacterium]|nr:hypothetical protein [Bacteroidaceae bacterium]
MNVNFEVNTCTLDDGKVTSILYMDGYENDNMELEDAIKLHKALGNAIDRAQAMESFFNRYKKGGES